MAKELAYIKPSGGEVDCAYYPKPGEYIRGFLRLPHLGDSGRIRFVEDVHEFHGEDLAAIPISLLDGSAGTPACLLDCFMTSHTFSMPTPPAFPLTLLVNGAIVGTDDSTATYEGATVRSKGLLDFLGSSAISPEAVAAAGVVREERATAAREGWDLTLSEVAEMATETDSASLDWHGEITVTGAAERLDDWGETLNEMLLLFAVLTDRPVAPDRMYALQGADRVELYLAWTERSAPRRTIVPFTLADIEDRFDDVVRRWRALLEHAKDFVNHVVEFQSGRGKLTQPDQVLLLVRSLELYHAFADRFESNVRPRPEHKAIVREVAARVPGEIADSHGEWIKGALSEANRKRLVAQVIDVLDDLGVDVTAQCRIADTSEFATIAKNTRNHYTHPTGPAPSDVPEGRELIMLVNKLWFVVRACVFIELGFDRDEIAGALKRSGSKHYLLA